MIDPTLWLRQRLRAMQIIALVLGGGATLTTAVMIGLRANDPAPAVVEPTLSYVALVVGAIQIAASLMAPALMEKGAFKRLATLSEPSPQRLVDVYQLRLIVSLALLESAVIFGAIAFRLEGQTWALTPCLIGIALMGLKLPTELNLSAWVDAAGRRVQEMREQP